MFASSFVRSFVRRAQFLKLVSRKRTFDKIKILKKNNFHISSENDINAFMWLCSKTFDVEIFNVGRDSNCDASRISVRYENKFFFIKNVENSMAKYNLNNCHIVREQKLTLSFWLLLLLEFVMFAILF